MPLTPLAALADVTGLPLTSGSWGGREWRDEGASPLWAPEASAHGGQPAPGETEALPAPRREQRAKCARVFYAHMEGICCRDPRRNRSQAPWPPV